MADEGLIGPPEMGERGVGGVGGKGEGEGEGKFVW